MSGSEAVDQATSGSEAADQATSGAEAGAATPESDSLGTSRLVITGGGRPDAEQLAALVVALTPGRSSRPETGPPAWRRAALLEGIGEPAVPSPGDLGVATPRRR